MGGNPEGHVTLFQESGQFDQLLGLLGGSMEKTSRQERQVDALKTAKTLGLLGVLAVQWRKPAAKSVKLMPSRQQKRLACLGWDYRLYRNGASRPQGTRPCSFVS